MGWWRREREVCICAAVRARNGVVIRGHRHADCFRNMEGHTPPLEADRAAEHSGQGFVTSRGRFVGRREAMRLQLAAGATAADGSPLWRDILYSEDLY